MRKYYIVIIAGIGLVLIALRGTIAINISESLPVGIYLQKGSEDVKRGDIVLFYSTRINQDAAERGYIRKGSKLGKRVVAIEGDHLQTGKKTIIKGQVISTKIQLKDSQNRPMEIFEYQGKVPPGHIFVIGDTPGSYDSRYYGFVQKSDIQKKLKPIFVWNTEK